ncbi:MAG: hypothetical protein K6L73_01310 [Cellvibrionaceae bacterium]
MNWNEFKEIIKADLTRYGSGDNQRAFWRHYFKDEGFKYTFWWRFAEYSSQAGLLRYVLYPILKLIHRNLSYKFGISIPIGVKIGPGFYIGHYGNVVISGDAILGRNCNVSQGVTIGQANRGKYKGTPVIGDKVYMATGSKIIGGITVGDNVLISANALITSNIDDSAVCVGVPAEVVSHNGNSGYIEFLAGENE